MDCGRLLSPGVLGITGGSFASLIGKPTRWGIDSLDAIRRGAAALLLASSTASFAQGLQISQVLDHASDLTVFVPFEKDLLGTKYTPRKEDYAAAAVGTTRLPVKGANILHAQDGFAVVLALDVSASMKRENFDMLSRTIAGVLTRLPAASQIALMTIGVRAQKVVEFGPKEKTITALPQLAANEPQTALNEAMVSAQGWLRSVNNLPARRFVLMITDGYEDGQENNTGLGTQQVLADAASGAVPLYVVVVNNRPGDVSALGQIARASGGEMVVTSVPQLESTIFQTLADALMVQELKLDCSKCVRDGTKKMLQIGHTVGAMTFSGVREVQLLSVVP